MASTYVLCELENNLYELEKCALSWQTNDQILLLQPSSWELSLDCILSLFSLLPIWLDAFGRDKMEKDYVGIQVTDAGGMN